MTIEVIHDWQGTARSVESELYWHWVSAGSFAFHNARMGHGFVASVSLIAAMPGLAGATTVYAAFNSNPEKEGIWETVRASSFPERPSRMKALFCFEDKEVALRARDQWFPHEGRELTTFRVVQGSNVWRADSKLLDGPADQWETNANRYWAAEMTEEPLPEVIIDGIAYFPDWQSFPFFSATSAK